MKSLYLIFTILVLIGLPFSAFGNDQSGDLRSVRASEFFSELDEAREEGKGVILDVRTPQEFGAGNAPGSINLDFYAADFRLQLDALDKNDTYFVYCRSGNRSGQALRMMRDLGFTEAYELQGGWSRNFRALSELDTP